MGQTWRGASGTIRDAFENSSLVTCHACGLSIVEWVFFMTCPAYGCLLSSISSSVIRKLWIMRRIPGEMRFPLLLDTTVVLLHLSFGIHLRVLGCHYRHAVRGWRSDPTCGGCASLVGGRRPGRPLTRSPPWRSWYRWRDLHHCTGRTLLSVGGVL